MTDNIERYIPKTKVKPVVSRIAMIAVAIFALILGLTAFNVISSSIAGIWLIGIIQILIGLVLVIEGSWKGMFSRAALKAQNLTFPKILGWLSLVVGSITIGAGILTMPIALLEVVPLTVVSFFNTGTILMAGLIFILAVINIFM